MNICVYENQYIMGAAAAVVGAMAIREAVAARGRACVVLATGASQLTVLERLVNEPGIDWSRVVCFHLDEYVGMPIGHPASFRKYLRERFVDRLPALGAFQYVNADAQPLSAEIERLNDAVSKHPADVAFIGIGENGHLAFNDPPADFDTESPYIVVDLDERCRMQQVGEGWFRELSEVPAQAVSMSVRQIMKSARIVCSVPDARKADAVYMALNAAIAPAAPCSMLRRHPDCHLMLDRASASRVLRAV